MYEILDYYYTHQECLYCFRGDSICLSCRDYYICKNNINFKNKEVRKKIRSDAFRKFYARKRVDSSWRKYDVEKTVRYSFMLPYGDSPLTDRELILVSYVKRVLGSIQPKLNVIGDRRKILFYLGNNQKVVLSGTTRGLKLSVMKKNKIIWKNFIKPKTLERRLNKLVKYGIIKKEVKNENSNNL